MSSDPILRRQQPNSASTEVVSEEALKPAPDLLLESEVFWDKYKLPIMAIIVIAFVGLLGSEIYRRNRESNLAEASAQLDGAKSIDDYKKIIAEHDGTLAAANASLLLARLQVDKKEYAAASETWKGFADKYSTHPLVPNALIGAAGALESDGKFAEARALYQRVEANYAKSYIAPLASLAEASLLKSQGKTDDAKRVYENVIATAPQSDAARQATENLRLLKAVPTLPAEAKAQPSASPAVAVTPEAVIPVPVVAPSPGAPVVIPAPAVVPEASPASQASTPAPASSAASQTPADTATPAASATPVPSVASVPPVDVKTVEPATPSPSPSAPAPAPAVDAKPAGSAVPSPSATP